MGIPEIRFDEFGVELSERFRQNGQYGSPEACQVEFAALDNLDAGGLKLFKSDMILLNRQDPLSLGAPVGRRRNPSGDFSR